MKTYAMFTEEGNAAVDALVTCAKLLELDWPETFAALRRIAKNPKFAEATDTEVREAVYNACGFKSEFYVLP